MKTEVVILQESKKEPIHAATRLILCAAAAAAVVYAAEKLCQNKHWAIWDKYGTWITQNKTQAISILAVILYSVSLVLLPEENTPRDGKSEETFTPCP